MKEKQNKSPPVVRDFRELLEGKSQQRSIRTLLLFDKSDKRCIWFHDSDFQPVR